MFLLLLLLVWLWLLLHSCTLALARVVAVVVLTVPAGDQRRAHASSDHLAEGSLRAASVIAGRAPVAQPHGEIAGGGGILPTVYKRPATTLTMHSGGYGDLAIWRSKTTTRSRAKSTASGRQWPTTAVRRLARLRSASPLQKNISLLLCCWTIRLHISLLPGQFSSCLHRVYGVAVASFTCLRRCCHVNQPQVFLGF